MAFNFNFNTPGTTDLAIKDNASFTYIFNKIHAYNKILAENGGNLSREEVIAKAEAMSPQPFTRADVTYVEQMNGGSMPTLSQEESLLQDYATWTLNKKTEAANNLRTARADANTPRNFTFTNKKGETKTITISPAELKKRASSAGKKKLGQNILRTVLIVGGIGLIGGLGATLLTTVMGSIFGSVAAVPGVLSALTGVAGLGVSAYGGILGNKLFNTTIGKNYISQSDYQAAYEQNKQEIDNALSNELSAQSAAQIANESFDSFEVSSFISQSINEINSDSQAIIGSLRTRAVQLFNEYTNFTNSIIIQNNQDITDKIVNTKLQMDIGVQLMNDPSISLQDAQNKLVDLEKNKYENIRDLNKLIVEELSTNGQAKNDIQTEKTAVDLLNGQPANDYTASLSTAYMVLAELKEAKAINETPNPRLDGQIDNINNWIAHREVPAHINEIYSYAQAIINASEEAEETSTEGPTEEVEETSTKEPKEEAEETSTEGPTEEAEETPIEGPTEEVEETPTEEPTEEAEETPIEGPTEEVEETPTEEPTEEAEETPTEEPTEEAEETPIEGPTEEVEETSTKEPKEEAEETSTEGPTEEAEETPTEEPKEEVEETPIEGPTEEAVNTEEQSEAEILLKKIEQANYQKALKLLIKSYGEDNKELVEEVFRQVYEKNKDKDLRWRFASVTQKAHSILEERLKAKNNKGKAGKSVTGPISTDKKLTPGNGILEQSHDDLDNFM